MSDSGENAFCQAVGELVQAVAGAFRPSAKLPAFILLYASIDILASLTRPDGQDDTDGGVFKNWVDTYLLPDSGLSCTASDIWGARCGILHTYTVQSRNSREGKARELHYVNDASCARFAQNQIDPNAESKVFVNLSDLLNAFFKAATCFTAAVIQNEQLRQLAFRHASKLIVHQQHPKPANDFKP